MWKWTDLAGPNSEFQLKIILKYEILSNFTPEIGWRLLTSRSFKGEWRRCPRREVGIRPARVSSRSQLSSFKHVHTSCWFCLVHADDGACAIDTWRKPRSCAYRVHNSWWSTEAPLPNVNERASVSRDWHFLVSFSSILCICCKWRDCRKKRNSKICCFGQIFLFTNCK